MHFQSIQRYWCMWLIPLTTLAGCTCLQDMHYEHTQKLRSELAFVKFAWCSKEFGGLDYAAGWKAGYLDVLTGNDGTPPLFAPHHYWSPSQVKGHCDQKRLDWYAGFQDGAMMASLQPDTHYLKVWAPPAAAPAGYYEAVPGTATMNGPALVPPSEDPGLRPTPDDFSKAPGGAATGNAPVEDSPVLPGGSALPPPPARPMPVP